MWYACVIESVATAINWCWFVLLLEWFAPIASWLFVGALLVYFAGGGLFEALLSLTDRPRFKRTRSLTDAQKHRRLVKAARRWLRTRAQADRVAYQRLVRVLYASARADDYARGLARIVR